MSNQQLSAKTRTDFSKSNTKMIRREGGIPATVYGHGDVSQSIEVRYDGLAEILKAPAARRSLIDLSIDETPNVVMIKDMQRDAITKVVKHVDFLRVKMDEIIQAPVPIRIIGEAPGVKLGGKLNQIVSQVQIRVLPDRIPSHIDVDVSTLEIYKGIRIDELVLPEGVEIIAPSAETTVISVKP